MRLPPVPAEGVTVNVLMAKLAEMVWFAVTLLNVYELIAPCETPSTCTSRMW